MGIQCTEGGAADAGRGLIMIEISFRSVSDATQEIVLLIAVLNVSERRGEDPGMTSYEQQI